MVLVTYKNNNPAKKNTNGPFRFSSKSSAWNAMRGERNGLTDEDLKYGVSFKMVDENTKEVLEDRVFVRQPSGKIWFRDAAKIK